LRLGLWTAGLTAIVLAVNIAGIWEIASTLRGLREQTARTLQLRTSERARAVESVLASATADLAFLVGSAAFGTDNAAPGRRWRDEVGSALLVFLRGHPEVKNLIVRAPDGKPAVEAGRPRDVPGYWVPGPASPSLDVRTAPIRRIFEIPAHGGPAEGRPVLDAVLDPPALLRGGIGDESALVDCALTDSTGVTLAGEPAARRADGEERFQAGISAPGWGGGGAWRLECRSDPAAPEAELEPIVARQRTAVVVNLGVMALAIGLGGFALHQFRRRRQFEDKVLEEERVRELERQLFHAERLSTVGRLAASMAHEINNPLEGMSNYLRLASDALGRGDAAEANAHVEAAGEGLTRAAGIVRRVLDHANPAHAVTETVDLPAVMARSMEFVRSRGEFAAIRFAAELPENGARVRGNGVMLGQVFLNLVLNACEAQPGGGEVLLRCRRDGDWVEADVADRGAGIPAQLRPRIFEPFASTKQSAGLGLSICHSIVRQHGGELTFHDREGGGSIFRVRIKSGGAVEENDASA